MKTKIAIGIVALIIAGLSLSMKPMSKLLPLGKNPSEVCGLGAGSFADSGRAHNAAKKGFKGQ